MLGLRPFLSLQSRYVSLFLNLNTNGGVKWVQWLSIVVCCSSPIGYWVLAWCVVRQGNHAPKFFLVAFHFELCISKLTWEGSGDWSPLLEWVQEFFSGRYDAHMLCLVEKSNDKQWYVWFISYKNINYLIIIFSY